MLRSTKNPMLGTKYLLSVILIGDFVNIRMSAIGRMKTVNELISDFY